MTTPKTPPKAPEITPALLVWLEHLYPVPRFVRSHTVDLDVSAERDGLLVAAISRSVVDRVREEYVRQQSKEEEK